MADDNEATQQGIVQVAYIVEDMDRAKQKFGEIYGIGDYFDLLNLEYPASDGMVQVNIALAYVGPVMIELIQPIGGDSTFYSAFLPEYPQVAKFHHVNWLFDNEGDFFRKKQSLANMGKTFAVEMQAVGSNVFYCDLRDDLGHYLEAVAPIDGQPMNALPIPRF